MSDQTTTKRQATAASTAPAIELKGISKAFGPVQANKDISIRVMPGTIHGIIGENGAGKSTLMSILYGLYKADKGEVWINGSKTAITDSQAEDHSYPEVYSAGSFSFVGPDSHRLVVYQPGEHRG